MLDSNPVGDMSAADQDNENRVRGRGLERLDAVVSHTRVPRGLRRLHALQHGVGHAPVHGIVVVERRFKERQMIAAINVDLRWNVLLVRL